MAAEDRELASRLLAEAIAADPRGKAGVAAVLGVSRSLLARVLSPRDPTGLSGKLAGRIIVRYHVVPCCPATQEPRPRSECRRLSARPAPTHHPQAMRTWKFCQCCPHKPETKEEKS